MSFSDHDNTAKIQKDYKIRHQETHFLQVTDCMPPQNVVDELTFNQQNIDVFSSEASRKEMVISPLLREIYKQYYQTYSFWIQKDLNYDPHLRGIPDYLLSKRSELGKAVAEPPVFVVIEAVQHNFEQGWGSCLGALVTAQRINLNPLYPVYGIVTDGNLWQFGRLVYNVFCQHPENFTIDRLERVYGALVAIMELVSQESVMPEGSEDYSGDW